MDTIFPSTALAKQQPLVKHAADKDIVRITEHGYPAYIFASEEVYLHKIDEAVENALQEQAIRSAIEKGREDYAKGNVVTGIQAARAETKKRRSHAE
jgi:PHD/YefM family antitoxin component YafN of YafNO toxin-antitoxin module